MLVFLLAFALFLLILHIALNYNERARLIRKLPGAKDAFILGNMLEIMLSPVDLFKLARNFATKYDGLYRFWAYPMAMVNICKPQDIEIVISSGKFNEKSDLYKYLKPWLQEGLLVSKGSKWQQRRKILTPTFHFNILKEFLTILEENSLRLIKALKETNGEPINIVPVISEYTLNSICETAMGTKLHEETTDAGKSYKKAIYELGELLVERFVKVYLFPDPIFNMTSIARKQKKHLNTLHHFTDKVIKERREYVDNHGIMIIGDERTDGSDLFMIEKKKKTAMLDLLISAEKDGLIDRNGIQEEVDTFMFEGHDTTASALVFCLMLLANHKEEQNKIYAELNNIFGDSQRATSYEDLSMMRYLECCIKESLRLYPPVPFISRNITENVQLGGCTIPKGTFCHIHIFDLHRREDLFSDPLVFNPDRFLPENCEGRHSYAYIPFSAGPRNCIGQKFALMEMKSCVSSILRNFELHPVTKESDLEFVADIVLRTNGPIYVKFVPRFKKSV